MCVIESWYDVLTTVSFGFLTGHLIKLVYRMSEGSGDQQMEHLLKRTKNSDEDSAEGLQATKRRRAGEEHTEDDKKYPKKKVVLLMAYSGKGYYGMQVHSAAGPLTPHPRRFFIAEFEPLCFREIQEPLSSGPLKTIWWLR